MLVQMALFYSFSFLSNILSYIYIYLSHLLYPFLCGKTYRLLPFPGYYKPCCNETEHASWSIYMTVFVKEMPRFKWDFSLFLERQLDRYRAPPLGCPAPSDIISVCSSIQSPWKYLTWWPYLFYPSNCIISCFLMRREEQMSDSMYQFLCCGCLPCQARELASQKCIYSEKC